ncbi:MAG: PKD domain-containing protein [Kiritimatiellae bacterium]|nr:PKD domain-containing protein [Kiritimatiellia bacterium]
MIIKKLLSIASMMLSCIAALAADYYVDANADSATATGSQAAPFTSIKAAVEAANAQYASDESSSTIFVKGGDASQYYIRTADDLISITAANLTICKWPGFDNPKVHLDMALSESVATPVVIMVEDNADFVTIRDIEFYPLVDNNTKKASLGKSGRIIGIYGGDCTIDSCKFIQNEKVTNWDYGGTAMIHCEAKHGNRYDQAYNMVIQNCYFKNVARYDGRAISSGEKAKMISNIFENCQRIYWSIQYAADGHFISNRVINAREPIYSNGENYKEHSNIEIAYNIFVCDDDSIPFIHKNEHGIKQSKIHHNTIIGGKAFVAVEQGWELTWTPSIYNNLIILTDKNSVVISERDASVGSTKPTTFNAGSTFNNNAWIAPAFNGGSAPEQLAHYKLEADSPDSVGLYIDNNIELQVIPNFIETEDIFSEDYYRLNSLVYSWANGIGSPVAGEPAYIGAQEPIADAGSEGELFDISSFVAEAESFSPQTEITFNVSYALNVGAVTFSWDFDGDGEYDYTGEDTTAVYSYPQYGDFTPTVKATDSATGKEVIANLTSVVLKIRRNATYVDSLAAPNGDGSEQNPYRTIAKAVSACAEGETVYVRGGDDRVYEINTADDLIYILEDNTTITSWGDFGNPKVVISHSLDSIVKNPRIIDIDIDVFGTTISELNFVWYGKLNPEHSGDSIGWNGRVINSNGSNTTIKNCGFRVEGGTTGGVPKSWAIACDSGEHDKDKGEYLLIENCTFEGCTDNGKFLRAIWTGIEPIIRNNVFTNCYVMFAPVKGDASFYTFTSNTMYECRSIQSNNEDGNYNELQYSEIAYNKFITSTGEPFITKNDNGLHRDTDIHHNTVIGSSSFILIKPTYNGVEWAPNIYDNLIILAEDGILFNESPTFSSGNFNSTFKSESTFNNNVYLASAVSGGSAVNLNGYSFNLEPTDCFEINAAPRFISTKPGDADEYRMRATKLDWPFTASVGGYPNYVGAVEPFLAPLSTLIIVR